MSPLVTIRIAPSPIPMCPVTSVTALSRSNLHLFHCAGERCVMVPSNRTSLLWILKHPAVRLSFVWTRTLLTPQNSDAWLGRVPALPGPALIWLAACSAQYLCHRAAMLHRRRPHWAQPPAETHACSRRSESYPCTPLAPSAAARSCWFVIVAFVARTAV